MKGNIYKAKRARRPARPAPAMRAEFLSAAPVASGVAVAAEPEAPAPEGEGEEPEAPVGFSEAVATGPLPGEPAALAVEVGATGAGPTLGRTPVWLLGKRLLMQSLTHFA